MSVDTALHPAAAGQPPLGVLDIVEQSPCRFQITIAVHEVQP
jgi:hypothetical protein